MSLGLYFYSPSSCINPLRAEIVASPKYQISIPSQILFRTSTMLLNPSGSTLAGLYSMFLLSVALPFFPHPRDPQPESLLIPRASYSVVPVDGGAPSPTAGASPGSTTTVIEIITQTPIPQTTLTIVSTEIVPAGTETLTSTATITAQDTTELYVVTVTPAAATVTVTAAGQQPVTVTITSPAATEYASAAATFSVTASTHTGLPNSTYTLTTITAASSPVSSTYDDGLWHTTYPVWSNSSSATISARTPLLTTTLT
jgi:hypothetical protein